MGHAFLRFERCGDSVEQEDPGDVPAESGSGSLLRWEYIFAVLASALCQGAEAAFGVRYAGWLDEGFALSASWAGFFANAIAIGNLLGSGSTLGLARMGTCNEERSVAVSFVLGSVVPVLL